MIESSARGAHGGDRLSAEQNLDVVILDFAGTETEAAIAGLCRVFGVDETTASNLVAHLPKSVQRGVPRVRAEYFRRALELIGARVEVRTREGDVVEPERSNEVSAPEPVAARPAPAASAPPPPDTLGLGAWAPEPAPEPASKPDDGRTIGPGARRDGASPASAPPPAAARTLPEAAAPVVEPPVRAPRDPSLPPAVDDAVADPLPSDDDSDPPAATGGRREPTYVPSPDALRPDEESGRLHDPAPHSANPFDDDPPDDPHQARAPETVREPMGERFGDEAWEPRAKRRSAEPEKPRERRPPPDVRQREGRSGRARPAAPTGAASARAAGAMAAGALAASAGAAFDDDDEPTLGTRPPLNDAWLRDDGAGPVGVRPGVQGIASQPPELSGVEVDGRSFWAAIPDALVLPFAGRGIYWVLAVGMWSVVVAVLGLLGSFVPILGAFVYFFAYTSLLAFACDYFRVCMWSPPTGETELDRSPETDPALILNNYIKKGLHLSLFSMVSQIPLLWWVIEHLVDLDFMGILTSPITWLLAALPSFYWPMGVAMTALGHDFSKIWYVPAGFRVIVQVPLQYLTAVAIGYAAFGLSWVFLALFGSFLGLAGSILAGTVGLPLGICHGLFGSLIGHILRAHPEAFE